MEIKTNPKISREGLSKILNISKDTIKEYLERLREKGYIKRIGKTSAGHWKVLA